MNVSLNWLSDHLDLAGRSTQELADLLTFAGIEVEKIEARGVRSDSIVAAQVVSFIPHPNADRLRLCQVDDGSGTPRQIVCGAKNFAVGDKVPLALPGAVLPGNMTIKEGKLRGELSQGMLCSGRELGLSDDTEGLMILPPNAPVGRPLHEIVESDTLFELEVTPNRPDCLSHLGVARELSALARIPLKAAIAACEAATHSRAALPAEVKIEDLAACPFYTARMIRGIKVGPSPDWLTRKLASIGLRPINNVVDITNYVLFEMGQPLHAFDLAKLNGGIVVRRAREGETIKALDGKVHSLTSDDCVIADNTRAVAIAGVMGGEETGVTDGTTEILLESAYFHPGMVRKTSRRLGLISDSSYRFERGVDPMQVAAASDLASRLLIDLCGGKADETCCTAGAPPVLTSSIPFDLGRANKLLGTQLTAAEVTDLLGRLGLKESNGSYAAPSYRADLQRPVDLVEEIARVHGIQNIPATHGALAVEESGADLAYDFLLGIKLALAGRGFFEAQTIKLIAEAQLPRALGVHPVPVTPVALKNPLSDDHTHLRPSLIPGLIDVAARNIRQGATALRFFEAGTVFTAGKKESPDERTALALLLSGPIQPPSWAETAPRAADLFELRSALEGICQGAALKLKPLRHGWLLLASQILVNGKPVGLCGQLRPSEAKKIDARSAIYLAELSIDLLQKALVRNVRFQEMPKFPAITRDVALGVPKSVAHSQFDDVFTSLKSKEPLLAEVEIFDVFMDATGQKIAADQKSVAYRLTYRNREKTLESSEVDAAHSRIIEAVKQALPVVVR